MTIRPFFRWYDLWIGAYFDRETRTLYVCPLPTIGVAIGFKSPAVDVVDYTLTCWCCSGLGLYGCEVFSQPENPWRWVRKTYVMLCPYCDGTGKVTTEIKGLVL